MVGIRARRKAERPGEILEAAFDVFVSKGYAATRVEDIAARVGLTKGTIYLYFESKEKLFEAAIRSIGCVSLAQLVEREPRWTGDIAEDLTTFLKDLYHFVGTDSRGRETLRLLIAEAHRLPQAVEAHFANFMDPIFDRLKVRIEEAVAAGHLRHDIADLPELVVSTPFAQHVILMLFADRRVPVTADFLQSHLKLLFGGILPRPSDDPRIAWSTWRPVPDLQASEILMAPIGAGLYELRQRSGELLLAGTSSSVVTHLATVLLHGVRPHGRKKASPRPFLASQRGAVEYRTVGCSTFAEAEKLTETLSQQDYRFGLIAHPVVANVAIA